MIVFLIALIAIWALIYELGDNILKIWKPYVFASPAAVFSTMWKLVTDGSLGIAVLVTMRRMVAGYCISVVLGTALGLLVSRMKYLNGPFNAFILGLHSLPSICWLPFAILWFGIDESSILFVTVLGSLFAIAIAVESGIRNITPLYLRAARTMGAHGLAIYRDVMLPASLPALVAGLRHGWSFAWRALMAGEMLAATRGVGVILMQGRDFADITQVMAMMVVIIALGLFMDKCIFGSLENNVRHRWGLDRK